MIYYSAHIKQIVESEDGVTLEISVPEQVQSIIKHRVCNEIQIGVDDGRSISPAQNRKAHAMLRDMGDYLGYPPEAMKEIMKIENMRRLGADHEISMRDCSVTEAREFINTLMDRALREGMILNESGLMRTDDIDTYLIQCIRYRRCCICGRQADIHHEDTIGMGQDRRRVDDSMKRVCALCRIHHMIAHQQGWRRFSESHKIYGIERYRVKE